MIATSDHKPAALAVLLRPAARPNSVNPPDPSRGRWGPAFEHQSNYTDTDHHFAMIEPGLIIGVHLSRPEKRADGSFDDPAAGESLEGFDLITRAHDFQPEPAKRTKLFDPQHQVSQTAAVRPDHLEVPQPANHVGDHALGRVAILYRCTGDRHRRDQSQSVYSQGSFSSLDLLTGVVAGFIALLERVDRLTIKAHRSGRHRTICDFTQMIVQPILNEDPNPILVPGAEVAVDITREGKVLRQEPAGSTAARHIEDLSKDPTAVMLQRMSSLPGLDLWCGQHPAVFLPFPAARPVGERVESVCSRCVDSE